MVTLLYNTYSHWPRGGSSGCMQLDLQIQGTEAELARLHLTIQEVSLYVNSVRDKVRARLL